MARRFRNAGAAGLVKRKGLESKGWVIGSAKDFLNLSAQEEAHIELRLKLAESLKIRRKQRGSS